MIKTNFTSSKFFQEHAASNPTSIIDVGARGGLPKEWQPFQHLLQAYCFEPATDECQRLQNSTPENINFIPQGLAEKHGPQTLHINQNPATSSIYPANPDYIKNFPGGPDLENLEQITVECNSLDAIAETKNFPQIDFIKLDTQGCELDILEGGTQTLKSCFGLMIEVEFFPIYQQQPLFAEVDTFLRQQNFTIFSLKQSSASRSKNSNIATKGQLLWGHALYLKDFIVKPELVKTINTKKILNFISIAELYGHPDFSLELSKFFHHQNHLDDHCFHTIHNLLTQDTKPGTVEKVFDKIKNIHYLFH